MGSCLRVRELHLTWHVAVTDVYSILSSHQETANLHLMLGVARRTALLGAASAATSSSLLDQSFFGLQQLTPAQEASVVDPLERALSIYQGLGPRLQGQVAAAHYQLGAFHAKTWMAQRDR